LGIWDSGILSRCPNHLSLCVFMNLTRSCPLISSRSSWLYRILHPSWSCTGPCILCRIFRSKDLRAFSSSVVIVQISDPYVITGRTSVLYIIILVATVMSWFLNSWILA
jgi:hypothetical protein